MTSDPRDIAVLRDLAKRYRDICDDPEQDRRRDAWRRHNSLKFERPPIYARAFAWGEMPARKCQCADPTLRKAEFRLRMNLFWDSLRDDTVFEPWRAIQAVHKCAGWGVEAPRHKTDVKGGSFKIDYPLKKPEDIEKLREPWHEIDEEATAREYEGVAEAIDDITPVRVDRAPAYHIWGADISTHLGYMRGIENFMEDMMMNPEWLHRLCGFMRDGILKAQAEAEAAGDWSLFNSYNQAVPYAEELEDPAADVTGVTRDRLWCFMGAQEFTGVGPAQHDEFMLQYQLPILKKFGLVAYGCCEDLTRKIDMVRQIPNLRRIAVTPFADVARCAEQIGPDYVLSYRPNPTDMVSYGFHPERVRRILRRDLEACKANDCVVDITLKDVQTVEGDPDRVRRWVALAREVIDEVYG